jgi:hypothetical protein
MKKKPNCVYPRETFATLTDDQRQSAKQLTATEQADILSLFNAAKKLSEHRTFILEVGEEERIITVRRRVTPGSSVPVSSIKVGCAEGI